MVGYNVGGGGGSGSSQKDYIDDTAKPDFVLEGYTFHAGDNPEPQVGRIKSYDGRVLDGPGSGGPSVAPSTSKKHIPAGTYLSQDVTISPITTETKTIVPKFENQIVNSSGGKYINKVKIPGIRGKVAAVYRSGTNSISYLGTLDFVPEGVCVYTTNVWDSGDGNAYLFLYALRKSASPNYAYAKIIYADSRGRVTTVDDQITSIEWSDPSYIGAKDGQVVITTKNSYFNGDYEFRVWGRDQEVTE